MAEAEEDAKILAKVLRPKTAEKKREEASVR